MKEKSCELFDVAKSASRKAYAPYSNFHVGAAVKTKSGKIYTGCNVENASYSLSMCAERTAIFKAVSEGETEFDMVVVYVDSDIIFPPCGACRQVIAEFGEDIKIVYGNDLEIVKTDIKTLLPQAFSL